MEISKPIKLQYFSRFKKFIIKGRVKLGIFHNRNKNFTSPNTTSHQVSIIPPSPPWVKVLASFATASVPIPYQSGTMYSSFFRMARTRKAAAKKATKKRSRSRKTKKAAKKGGKVSIHQILTAHNFL